jgi:hypothetical protein
LIKSKLVGSPNRADLFFRRPSTRRTTYNGIYKHVKDPIAVLGERFGERERDDGAMEEVTGAAGMAFVRVFVPFDGGCVSWQHYASERGKEI